MERYLQSSSARSQPRRAFDALRRALLFFVLSVLGPASMPSRAAASTAVQDLTFQTTGQSIWGTGREFVFNYSDFWGASWNGGNSGGVSTDVKTPDVTICDPTGACNVLHIP